MILTPRQAAKKTGLNEGTIRNWCKSGYLQSSKFGNRFAIKQDDLKATMQDYHETYPYRNKEWLKKQLESKSIKQIASECYVVERTIADWARRFKLTKKAPAVIGAASKGFSSGGYKGFHRAAKL